VRNLRYRHHFRDGVVVIVVAVLAFFFAFTRWVPFVHHHTLRAVFDDSSELHRGSAVRIAGVDVGKVTGVAPLHPGHRGAVVTMTLDSAALPLHRDAEAKIRMRTALEGNEFVDIRPGTPSAGDLGDGGTIPLAHTATPVQLDQVLSTFTSDTRQQLVTILDQYGKALDGRGGRGFNASLRWWPPAYRYGSQVNEALQGEHPHDLSGYISSTGVVSDALDRDPESVHRLITRFDQTAAAFAAERQGLSDTVRELPPALSTARSSLADVRALLPGLDRLAVALRPAVRTGVPTIDAAMPFLDQLRALVRPSELQGLARDLDPTTASLAKLSVRSVPLLGQTRAASSCQVKVILPWANTKIPDSAFPPSGPVFEETVKGTLPGLAGESRSGDANGQWFTPLVLGGTNVVDYGPGGFATTALPVTGVNPRMPQSRPPIRPAVPCDTQKPPDLASIPGAPPRQFRVNLDTPEAKARLAKSRDAAIKLVRHYLDVEGLSHRISVSVDDLTPELLAKVKPATPQFLNGVMRRKP